MLHSDPDDERAAGDTAKLDGDKKMPYPREGMSELLSVKAMITHTRSGENKVGLIIT